MPGQLDETTVKATEEKRPNSPAQKARIQNGMQEWLKLEDQMERAIEQHVKPIKDLLKKAKRDLKADTDIPLNALNAQYKVLKLLADARKSDEEGVFEDHLEHQRIIFAALHPGDQPDWVAALNGEYDHLFEEDEGDGEPDETAPQDSEAASA